MKRILGMFFLFGLLFSFHRSAFAVPLSQGDRAKCLQMLAENYGMATSKTELNGNLADVDSMLPGCLQIVAASAPRADDIQQMCSDIASKKVDIERAMGQLLATPTAPICVTMQQAKADADASHKQIIADWKKGINERYRRHEFDCLTRGDETPRSAKFCAISRVRLAYVRWLFSVNDFADEDWSSPTWTGGSTGVDTPDALPFEKCPTQASHAYGSIVATVTTNNGVIAEADVLMTSGYKDLDAAAIAYEKTCHFSGHYANMTFTLDLPYTEDAIEKTSLTALTDSSNEPIKACSKDSCP